MAFWLPALFLLYGGFVEAAFCVFGNRRGLRGVKLARGWSGRRRRLRKKNAWEIFLKRMICFLGGFFVFFLIELAFCFCNEVTKPRNTRCGGILRPKKEKTYSKSALKGRLNIFIM